MFKNYKLVEKKYIKDIDSECILLEHEKTKARVFIAKNNDNNKVFNIAFRTPVSDNTGVPHILEHSVLCGSKKYPIKDPFVELAKSSFNTFLNAMTFPDKTCYPVASCNYKDFRNLMDVYLDAVFNPKIYENKQILMQEGWHYEFDDKDNLIYNGVVYNEMKGVYSDPESLLERQIYSDIFSGTNYAYEYGGDPKYIPSLTQEDFINFHKKYYHPSNSYIYLYGDMNFSEVLEYIDRDYLSKYTFKQVDSKIETFKTFLNIKENICYYNDEPGINKDYLSYTFSIKNSKNAICEIICSIINLYLMDQGNGIVFNKLLENNLCQDSYSSFSNEQICGIFTFEALKTNAKNKDKFQKIIDDTFINLYKNGFDKDKLLSCINKIKFSYKENDSGTFPKGLASSLKILNSWLYDLDPFIFLEYEDEFDKIDEQLLKKFIKDNFIDNTSKTIIACIPNEKYFEKIENDVKADLLNYKNSLSDSEMNNIRNECVLLKNNQEAKDTFEELKVLPTLTIKDVEDKKEILKYKTSKILINKVDSNLIYTDSNNNGIIYYSLVFDITKLNKKFYPFLTCITHCLTKLSTNNYTIEQLNNLIDINIGDITFDILAFENKNIFTINVKVLKENLDTSFKVVDEIISNTIFNNKKKIIDLIKNLKAESNNKIKQMPHATCALEVSSYYSKISDLENNFKVGAIGFNEFINNLYTICIDEDKKNNLDIYISTLNILLNYILNMPLDICISCTRDEKSFFINIIKKFKFQFFNKKYSNKLKKFLEAKYNYKSNYKNVAYAMPTDVSYVARGCNLNIDKIHGALLVLKTICSYDYLWTNIRVLGGAYGSMFVVHVKTGLVLVSYRDPHIKNTNNVYDKFYNYLNNFNLKQEEIEKYIIGTLASFDMPKSKYLEFLSNILSYYNDITNEDVVMQRNEIISSNIKSIKFVIKNILNYYKQSGYTCISNYEKLNNENNKQYKEVIKLNV